MDFALYIHYPFCNSRCPYCDFATQVEQADESARYRDLLLQELRLQAGNAVWKGGTVTSIYIGGGTPSLMPPEYLTELISEIRKHFNIATSERDKSRPYRFGEVEFTIEANPVTRDSDRFRAFREAGVNRLSIGAQSFQPEELEHLGRRHMVVEIGETVSTARTAGFDNLSLDLIYGVPGQTVASFGDSVKQALDLGIDHLSTYTLSIEPGTPFATRIQKGDMKAPDSDLMADQYSRLCDLMKSAGFEHYELTNFARPGYHSRHNFAYWRRQRYLALGLGSHSFDGQIRSWNTRDLDGYFKMVENGELPTVGSEAIDREIELQEQVYLSLRTSDGLSAEFLRNNQFESGAKELVEEGFMIFQDGLYTVAEEHWLLLDSIVLRLMERSHQQLP